MKSTITLLFLIIISLSSYSQHIKINKKRLSFLKSEKAMNVVFNYDNHTRGGDNISELEYIEKREKRQIAHKKDPEVWHTYYKNSKNIHWKDAFIDQLNKSLYKHQAPEFLLYSDIKTNFTMKVNVLWIYSGYDLGVVKWPSKLDLKLEIINNSTNQIIETIIINKAQGENTDFDNDSMFSNLRLVQNAFKTAGFKLAITLQRVFKKK